jgi:hypothetical protein
MVDHGGLVAPAAGDALGCTAICDILAPMASPSPRASAWLVLAVLGTSCGPSTRDGDETGGSGSATATETGTETLGIENVDDSGGTCRDLVPCAAFEVEVTGFCRAIAYTWDGIDCVEVSGCECTGPDCCHLAATYDACLASVTDTCEELPFCLTCEPGTVCFTACDHVGGTLDGWCVEVTEECSDECICEAHGYGFDGSSSCEEAHPTATICVI